MKKIGKLRGGHAIFKWCFPNPTSPPSLVKNERSLRDYMLVHRRHESELYLGFRLLPFFKKSVLCLEGGLCEGGSFVIFFPLDYDIL